MINVNRRRNYYNCERFGYIARYYRSWRIVEQERRIEYGDNHNILNNLKEEKFLTRFL